MYTNKSRYLEPLRLQGSGRSWTTVINMDYRTPTLVEGVYSWRTGKNSISDPPPSPDRPLDQWGIIAPTRTGNLVERLADRKRYYEEVERAAFPAETQSGSVSVDRVSKVDSGHLFASHKTLRSPYLARMDHRRDSNYYYNGHIAASCGSGVNNPSPYPMLPSEDTTNYVGVSAAVRQGMANRYFAATAPDRNEGSLAVTLVELLRGDIPSVLKNFREMMAGYRSIKNLVGSDALNIMFGWTPLIQEYANLIKVGMGLERVIYYESFRRQRQWDGPSTNGSTVSSKSLNTSAQPFFNRTYPDGIVPPSTGYGAVFLNTREDWVASEDYYFSSRYTGLAKATRRADTFSDKAFDVVKRLGLVDDPQMLWDLTPYSWLVDWFTTMGDSISNANVYSPIRGKYNVDYAYLTTKNTYASSGKLGQMTGVDPSFTQVSVLKGDSMFSSVTKWRDRATPFGFGTQLGSLSATQYGILVALGLARFR